MNPSWKRSDITMTRRIVIVGGGITGLTAAFRLRQAAEAVASPTECTVLEAAPRFGGKIDTLREGPFVVETGPDSILARKQAGPDLIRDLGIESEIVSINRAAQKTFILHQGQLRDLPAGTNLGVPATRRPFGRSNTLVSRSGKLRALQDLVLPVGELADDISLGELLKGRLGDEWVSQICEPLLGGIYAGNMDRISTLATFPQFLEMLRTSGSLIRGAAKLRRQALAQAPKLEETGRSAFITLNHGLITLIERLFDCVRDWANLQANARVASIRPQADGTYEIMYRQHGEMQRLTADAVILTVPAPIATQLLSSFTNAAAPLLGMKLTSTATVALGFEKAHTQGQFQGQDTPIGSGFVIPRSENRSITACTWTSSKWPHTAANPYILVRCYVGNSNDSSGLALSDEACVDMIRAELRDIVGLQAEPLFARVSRWENAMPQYQVGHLATVASVEQRLAEEHPGIQLAGASYHGVGIPDCIANANDVAARVWSALRDRDRERTE